MLQDELPRVYELRNLIDEPNSLEAYFQDFESSISQDPSGVSKKDFWLKREEEFQFLDHKSWEFLKNKALPYLTVRDPNRGWQQLISILNESRGYIYLTKIGCSDVQFISEATSLNTKRPDVEGNLNSVIILCDVKTLFKSDIANDISNKGQVSTIEATLSLGFFKKLKSTIESANQQIKDYQNERYQKEKDLRRVVYLIPNFEEGLGEHNASYFAQIDQYLGEIGPLEIEMVFRVENTAFKSDISMKNATVINEEF